MSTLKKYIIGLGHAVPPTIRAQADGVFGNPSASDKPFGEFFTGHRERRILTPGESLAALMTASARQAMTQSSVLPKDLGALWGFASVSEYTAPNELYAVHRGLQLPSDVPVFAIDDPFTAFISCLRLAELEANGSGKSSLIVCGARWSSNVDYREGVSVSIGDGAGAAVVGLRPSSSVGLEIVGHKIHTDSHLYGAMCMTTRAAGLPVPQTSESADARPLFHMTAEMRQVFSSWGVRVPAEVALQLLAAHDVDPSQVVLMGHQASRLLVEGWEKQIRPAATLDTLETLGNMTLASLPVSLAVRYHEVQTPYILLLGLGLGFHTAACLLRTGLN